MPFQSYALIISALLLASPSHAELAVAAADGKQLRPDDEIDHATPDRIAVLDLSRYPPKTLATIDAPASMIGPPSAVAVARDESFALVTAAQQFDSADPPNLKRTDLVSVVDLRDPAAPRVIQTAHAGPGASGVSINREATLALVASTEDEAVTVFSIRNRKLSRISQIHFPEGSRPTDVAFTPDGERALVVRSGDHRISMLAVEGDSVTLTDVVMTPGRRPYGIAISPDGRFAYTNNLGGAATRAEIDAAPAPARGDPRPPGTVSAVDLTTYTLAASVEVGRTPETVALSPDGKMLAVVVANGASVQKLAPNYESVSGLLHILRVDGGTLEPVATLENGHWCQGAAFSRDGKTLLVQCGSERAIEVYRIEGHHVSRDESATIVTKSRGGSLATAFSR